MGRRRTQIFKALRNEWTICIFHFVIYFLIILKHCISNFNHYISKYYIFLFFDPFLVPEQDHEIPTWKIMYKLMIKNSWILKVEIFPFFLSFFSIWQIQLFNFYKYRIKKFNNFIILSYESWPIFYGKIQYNELRIILKPPFDCQSWTCLD